MTTTQHGLARRSVGPAGLWVFGVSASAPMTVLAGGVVATYATTGVIAVPLSFVVLTAVLLLFSVGYLHLARQAPHAATFVALLATGLGPTAAVGGAAVAVLAYNGTAPRGAPSYPLWNREGFGGGSLGLMANLEPKG